MNIIIINIVFINNLYRLRRLWEFLKVQESTVSILHARYARHLLLLYVSAPLAVRDVKLHK
jgi:hypothetical protein